MVAERRPAALVEDLASLAHSLESLDLGASHVLGHRREDDRERLVRTIRSYLVPRLVERGPLCVVLAGPTGSGKSTLVNSLAGHDLSETGPLRPTTSSPIVLTSSRYARYHQMMGGVECEIRVGSAPVLDEMVFVDTPDIDSTSLDHRVKAEIILDQADIVVFVTSGLRYADLVPWQVLRRALSRGTPVISVLNRYSSASAGAVVDLASLLEAEGLSGDVIRVPEHHIPAGAQAVPSLAVRELARRLTELARDRERYQREVLDRVLNTTFRQISDFIDVLREDAESLASDVDRMRGRFELQALPEVPGLISMASVGDLAGSSRRSTRRGLRRIESSLSPHLLRSLREAIVDVVQVDLRSRCAMALSGDDRSLVTLTDIPTDLSAELETAIADWLGSIQSPEFDDLPALSAWAVASRVLAGDFTTTAVVLGDESSDLVNQARIDLLARLRVIYSVMFDRALARISSVTDDDGITHLSLVLHDTVARSHFANA